MAGKTRTARGPPPVPWIPPSHIPIAPYELPAAPPPPETEGEEGQPQQGQIQQQEFQPESLPVSPLNALPSPSLQMPAVESASFPPKRASPSTTQQQSPPRIVPQQQSPPRMAMPMPPQAQSPPRMMGMPPQGQQSPPRMTMTMPQQDQVLLPPPAMPTLGAALPMTVLSALPSGIGAGESLTSSSEILTHLSLLYDWRIPQAQVTLAQEEKLVSPPFGAFKETYQLVLFPHGVGEGAGTHVSVFLRPVKSDIENEAQSNWYRTISHFSVHVLGQGQGEQVYTHSETSGEDFVGFSEQTSGWGFNQYIPIDSLSQGLIDPSTDTLTLQCEILWPRSEILYTIQQSISLGPLQTLFQGTQEWSSPDFGSNRINWTLKARTDSNGQMGLFIRQAETPGKPAPDFKIASLSIKIFSGSLLVSTKTLTGGFHFIGQNARECGWDSFCSVESLDHELPLSASIQLDFLDPASHVSLVSASKNAALQSEIDALSQAKVNFETLLRANERNRLDLESKLKTKTESCQKLKGTLETVKRDMTDLFEKQAQALMYQDKIATVKKKLSGLLGRMNDGNLQDSQTSPGATTPRRDWERELAEVRDKNAHLELEIVRLQTESLQDTKHHLYSQVDDALRSPSPFSDNSGTLQEPLMSLSESMAKVREEIAESQLAIQEAEIKGPLSRHGPGMALEADEEVELTGVSADLIIRLAELEVARASLFSVVVSHPLNLPPDLDLLKENLQQVRYTLFNMIQSVNTDLPPPGVDLGSTGQSSNMQVTLNQPMYGQDQYNSQFGYPPEQQQPWMNNRSASPTQVADDMNEMKHMLYQVKELIQSEPARIEELVKNVVPASATTSGAVASLVEPWTPVPEPVPWSKRGENDEISGLKDNSELMKLLKELEKAQKSARRPGCLSLVVLFSTILGLFFSFYASAHILCSPKFEAQMHSANPGLSPYRHKFCHGLVLPTWDTLSGAWHLSAEYLVLDVFPHVLDMAEVSKQAFESTTKNTKKIVQDWQKHKRKQEASAEAERQKRVAEQAELARKRQAEEAELARKRQAEEAELARKRQAEEAELARKRQIEEAERARQAEEDRKKQEAAELARKQAEEVEKARRAEELRVAQVEAAQMAKKQAEEAEALRKVQEEKRAQEAAAEFAKRQAEEAKQASEKHAEAERASKQAEADALARKKQADEELEPEREKRAQEAIAESQRLAQEAEAARIAQEAEDLKKQAPGIPQDGGRLYDDLSVSQESVSALSTSIIQSQEVPAISETSVFSAPSVSSATSAVTTEYTSFTGDTSDVTYASSFTPSKGKSSPGPPPRRNLRHKGKPEPPSPQGSAVPNKVPAPEAAEPIVVQASTGAAAEPTISPVVTTSSTKDDAKIAPPAEESIVPIQTDEGFSSDAMLSEENGDSSTEAEDASVDDGEQESSDVKTEL